MKARKIIDAMEPGSFRKGLKDLAAMDRANKAKRLLALADSELEKIVAQDAIRYSEGDPLPWLQQLTEHGCSSGMVSHLIHHHETAAFYAQHKDHIWYWLHNEAQSQGVAVLRLLADFGGSLVVDDEATFMTLLVWAAYEAAAYNLVTKAEDEGA